MSIDINDNSKTFEAGSYGVILEGNNKGVIYSKKYYNNKLVVSEIGKVNTLKGIRLFEEYPDIVEQYDKKYFK